MSFKKNWKKYTALVGILFLFPLVWLLAFGVFGKHHFNTLPYFDAAHPEGADTTEWALPPFAFTNHLGAPYTLDSLKGKVWIAAFYSMSDPNLPRITERLLNINWRYRNEEDIAIVVFSTDQSADSSEATRAYVDVNTRYNGFPGKWQFLTAPDSVMQTYLRDGFFIRDIREEAIFRLVDTQGQVRGLYGNTEYHIRDAMEDIALLKKEIDQNAYHEARQQDH